MAGLICLKAGDDRLGQNCHIHSPQKTIIDMRHPFLLAATSAACMAWAIAGWAAPSDQQQTNGQGQPQQHAKGSSNNGNAGNKGNAGNNGNARHNAAATFQGAPNVQTRQLQQHVVQPQVQQHRTTLGNPGQPNLGQPQVQQHGTTQAFAGQPNVMPQTFNPRFGAPGYRPGGQQPQYSPQYFPRTFNMGVRYHWRGGSWRGPQGWYYRSWSYGQILPFAWLGSSWWITDYWDYGLPVPPYGYEWIRNGPDALLVDINTGEVVEVIPGIFY